MRISLAVYEDEGISISSAHRQSGIDVVVSRAPWSLRPGWPFNAFSECTIKLAVLPPRLTDGCIHPFGVKINWLAERRIEAVVLAGSRPRPEISRVDLV